MHAFKSVVCFIAMLVSIDVFCQGGDFLLGPTQFSYINYSKNNFIFPIDSNLFNNFYRKIDTIMLYGKGKVNIVHIGGSHIQADVYTHEIRKQLQLLDADMNGGRGFIFPYRIAHTNNPANFGVTYLGFWEFCKNTQSNRPCPLGLSGMAIFTSDKKASIIINPNRDKEITYTFNKVRVFHSPCNYDISVVLENHLYRGFYDSINGYSIFNIPESRILDLRFARSDSSIDKITIYGISLDNDNPGIVYNAIGVNGARLSSYLGCEYYSQQLASLEPDLIIFSIGTNDGNTRDFNSLQYFLEYSRLIEITRLTLPNVPILITVPNDCFLYKKYINKNTAQIQEAIMNLAKDKNCGVWDFYTIMGGLGSSQLWYNAGMMRSDRIHFSHEGYILKGDLFITAFLRGWEKDLAKRIVNYPVKKNETAVNNTYHPITE